MWKDPSVIVAVASAFAAWLAAIFAIHSSYTAKQTFKLAKEQEEKRSPNLILYLVDGFTCKSKDAVYRLYAFSLSISNISDADNSISNIELIISYRHSSDLLANAVLTHNQEYAHLLCTNKLTPFILPAQLGTRKTVSGWAVFRIKRSDLEGVVVNSYDLNITDTHGKKNSIEPIIVKEIEHESEETLEGI